MEATQTDIENPQLTSQEDGMLDSLVSGIMEQMDNTGPLQSGTVVSKPAEEPATEPEAEPESEAEPEAPASEEPEKFIIKWQGQEKEVTQDELLDLAQKGFDYTRKTQALADERNNLAPLQGLAKLMQDPSKAQQIAAILSGQAPQQQPEKKTFDDPIEQLKWETKQDILAEVRKEQQAALIPLHRQAALNQVRAQVQADPDYKEIHQQIIDMVKAQPPALQKTLYMQLDQDPAAYVETFQHFKNQKATKPATTTTPKPVKKETRAPILEAGGVESPQGIEGKAKTERISKLKAKALRNGDPTAMAEWLKASGAIDHLY